MTNSPDPTAALEKLWKPLLVFAGAVAFLHLYFLFRTNINWDEFRFLSEIYAIQGGYGSPGLNDFHALLYAWLTLLPFTEIGQILTARVVQLGLFLGAMVMLYRIFRDYLHPVIALVSVFLAICYSAVILHASSFRFDTLCLFFSVLSVLFLLKGKTWKSGLLGGLALAVSVLISIKTALWLPTILGVALVGNAYANHRSNEIRRVAVFALASVVFLAALLGLHALIAGSSDTTQSGAGTPLLESLSLTAHDMFLREGFLPRMDYLIRGITENPGHWLLLTIGTIAVVRQLFRRERRNRAVLALLLLAPLAAVAIYRNAFPYYYVYALPPAMLVAGIGLTSFAERVGKGDERLYQLIVMLPVLFGLVTSSLFLFFQPEGIEKQKRVINAVHEIFPEPVPYIGPHGMISSFPRVGPFMSTWGMTRYHERGKPEFSDAIKEREPKFLIVNHAAFFRNVDMAFDDPQQGILIPEDKEAVTQNYIDHWGPIRIAGKQLETGGRQEPFEFEIIISGPYRIEAESDVKIDGTSYEPGQVITLGKGTYRIAAPKSGLVVLRWGGDLPYPEEFAPTEWMYDGL